MSKIIIALFTILIGVPSFALSGKVVLTGNIQNHSGTVIKITRFNYEEMASTQPNEDGTFKMSSKLEAGYYLLNYGRNSAYIFLYPKDNLSMDFDAKDFENTLIFSGEGAFRNNYLSQKSLVESKLTENLEAFYKVDEEAYLKNIENVKNTHLASLNSSNAEVFFIAEEKKSLEYERLLRIQNYKSNYKFYLGEEITPSKNFYAPLKTVKLDNQRDYKEQPFYRYLVNSFWNKQIEAASDVDGMLKVLRKVPSREITITLVNGFYSKISSNKERAKDYLDLIKRVTTHKPFIEAAEKQYEEVINSKNLAKGNTSPTFNYEDINGDLVTLEDFKGKFVYIDVWATWCAPCIKQVPYLKKLEERYHKKNIVFVSISVDKEKFKPTWKKVIVNKELGGIQLFADNSFDSAFMNAYAVNSIPRFILIDPAGKIVASEAPRPSFEKTRKLLDELLN